MRKHTENMANIRTTYDIDGIDQKFENCKASVLGWKRRNSEMFNFLNKLQKNCIAFLPLTHQVW